MKKFTKRWAVRVVSFSVGISLVFLGAGISGYMLANQYKTTIENTYQQAVNDLTEYVDNIMDTLKKSMYANTSSQQTKLAAELLSESEGAKQSLSRLPLAQEDMDGLQKFFAQSGDFATYLINKLAHGSDMSEQDGETVKTLSKYANLLEKSMVEMAWRYGDGSTPIESAGKSAGNIDDIGESMSKSVLSDGFKTLNESFVDYPSLLYDGPFADHVIQRKPLMVENMKDFSQQEAKAAAAKFLNVDANRLTDSAERGGNLPSYSFAYDGASVSVTKKGGIVDYFYKPASSRTDKVTVKQARKIAADFLKKHGFEDMKESYYANNFGICVINFAKEVNDIIYYSDLIKVSVDMNTGDVVSYNATGYIMNSHDRNLKTPSLSADEASKSVSKSLQIQNSRLALIPFSNGLESLCYEFKCLSDDDENYLVYIDCETGMEENIYIMLMSDDGVLVL